MILRILDYLNDGKDFSNKAIQRNLGISEFMAESYKNQLVKGGYVRRIEDLPCDPKQCPPLCSSCCTPSEFGFIGWEITEKGKHALRINK
jgi:hypothetical protein